VETENQPYQERNHQKKLDLFQQVCYYNYTVSEQKSPEIPRFQRANTKSLTLETLVSAYFAPDPEEGQTYIDYIDNVGAERIRFASDEVTATIWRPGLDMDNPGVWQCPWDEEQGLRMRIFMQGNLGTFTFNGLQTDSIEVDMAEDGELRPIFDDPRGVQVGHAVTEADILRLITNGVELVEPNQAQNNG